MDSAVLALIALDRAPTPMVITDPRQPDNPVVLVNQAFLDLTGYDADEVVGRNCRFLQGPETSKLAVAQILAAIVEEREATIQLLNYRKDGATFWNQLRLSPIHDDAGRLQYFFASQSDVSEQRKLALLEAAEQRLLREVNHRSMNMLAVVEGIVRLSRADDPKVYARAVQLRVQALARVHAVLAQRGWREVPLMQLILAQVELFDARRIALAGPDVFLDGRIGQPLAMVLHELLSNAARHGALSRASGSVQLLWRNDKGLELFWCERGGPPPLAERPSGFGAAMIAATIRRQLKGRLRRSWDTQGLSVHLTIPL